MTSTQTVEGNGDMKTFITYPPFPVPPPGVAIIPFSQFKPLGIAVSIDGDDGEVEVDGLGVPTVTLNSRHDLTAEEKKMGKKKVANRTIVGPDGTRRQLWHEEWKATEKVGSFKYNPQESEFDRLWEASTDFKGSRAWPSSENPVSNMWDQIRLYIGLISNIQPPPSKRKKDQPLAIDPDDDDEYVQGKDAVLDGAEEPAEDVRITNETMEKALEESNASAQRDAEKSEKSDAKKDQRLADFLHDTETTIKIFFSSHWRDKGLAWDKAKSDVCPILMGFWLRFLIHHNAFPEPEIMGGLQRALAVCEQAQVELPATFVIAQALTDGVSRGMKDHFGKMTDEFVRWDNNSEDEAEEDTNHTVPTNVHGENDEKDDVEPEAKRRKIEEDPPKSGADIEINSNKINIEEAALMDAIADNVDINGVEVAPSGGWGDSWGNDMLGGWNSAGAAKWGVDAVDSVSDQGAATIDDPWAIQADPTLLKLLGGTADLIPATHTTGIVERSTRRIVKVVKPSESKAKPKPVSPAASAQAVEADLETKLAHVVLAPWEKVGNDAASDITTPVIQEHSRGDVVPIPAAGETPAETPAAGAFNPLTDEIHVLLDPETCDKLVVGMGLTATWVQLARKAGDDEPETRKKRAKKGGPGKNGESTKWWYMEAFMTAIMSFHTDRSCPE